MSPFICLISETVRILDSGPVVKAATRVCVRIYIYICRVTFALIFDVYGV